MPEVGTEPLLLADTHAHLFWEDFQVDLSRVMERAAEAGVHHILNLGTTPETSQACIELAESHPACRAAVGCHPGDALVWTEDPAGTAARIRELAEHPGVVAVGEAGLDFYRGRDSEKAQWEALECQFEIARETGLPLVLHNRAADLEIRDALQRWDEGVRVVLHAFTGDAAFGRWAIDRGHYLGLGGIITFSSSPLSAQVSEWDIDHLLLETDSPFLAPVPHRGERNEPAFVADTARAVAAALSMPASELAARTTRNAVDLFGFST